MMTHEKYSLETALYQGAVFECFRARDASGAPVIVKRGRRRASLGIAESRLHREWEIGSSLVHRAVLAPRELLHLEGRLALVSERFVGECLALVIPAEGLELGRFLDLAIQIAEGLAYVHERRIIHRDICPRNIYVDPLRINAKLCGFGVATRLAPAQHSVGSPGRVESSLRHISPECTGRINRPFDHRSDLYSLGATYYEMLTGHPPFDGTDDLEVIHAHIAREAAPPTALRATLPGVVSELVLRLLSKEPGDRYQSASGVAADLRHIRNSMTSGRGMDQIRLGQNDKPIGLQISERLYGRERERQSLMDAFETARNGDTEVIFVTGLAGVGKTALIRELADPVVAASGLFAEGKFDQYERNRPYGALVHATRRILRQILAASDADLKMWRERLQKAVGANGKLLADFLPELEWIIGRQPRVALLGAIESDARFKTVLQAFFKALARPSHPLVLFLDDLQWADPASLVLLERVLGDASVRNLLVITAYRDNEVHEGHPWMSTLRRIAKTGVRSRRIALEDLGLHHTTQLLQDSLSMPEVRVAPLAEILHRRTRGNPFFLHAVIRSLFDHKLLRYDPSAAGWDWNPDAIEQLNVSDDVVSFVLYRLQELPASTRSVLPIAASIGPRFDLRTLEAGIEGQDFDVRAALTPAIDAGVVVSLGSDPSTLGSALSDTRARKRSRAQDDEDARREPGTGDGMGLRFAFAHDRIQQASSELVDAAQRSKFHYAIGRHLMSTLDEKQRSERIIEIANHLNTALPLQQTEAERLELAAVNLEAGRRAKRTIAYVAAQTYLEQGLDLLDDHRGWDEHYRLAHALHMEAAETAYLLGDSLRMDELCDSIIAHSVDVLDKVKAFELRAIHLSAQRRYGEALQITQDVLEALGAPLPSRDRLGRRLDLLEEMVQSGRWEVTEGPASRHSISQAFWHVGFQLFTIVLRRLPRPVQSWPNALLRKLRNVRLDLLILVGLIRTYLAIRRHPIESLFDLPPMEDPAKLAAMRLLTQAAQPAFYYEPKLFPHLAFNLVQLSLKHGNSPHSAWGYAVFAFVLYGAFGSAQTKRATEYLDFAGELHRRIGAPELNAKMLNVLFHGFRHTTLAFRDCTQMLRQAFDAGIEVGDTEYASLGAEVTGQYLVLQGEPLQDAFLEMSRASEAVAALKHDRNQRNLDQHRQVVLNLIGDGEEPWKLDGSVYDGRAGLRELQDADDASYQCIYYHRQAFLKAIFGRYSEALKDEEMAEAFLKGVPGLAVGFMQNFYHAFALLAALDESSPAARKKAVAKAGKITKRFERWAADCPANYRNKLFLLRAELSRATGEELAAINDYEAAIQTSADHGLIHEQALACERAASFHRAAGREDLGHRYLQASHDAYERWGAVAKVKMLERAHPELVTERADADMIDTRTSSSQMDLRTVLKAGQVMSSEIQIANFLDGLMAMLVENAGAQRGYLLAGPNGELIIEASIDIADPSSAGAFSRNQESANGARPGGHPGPPRLPNGIVNYVARTQETVVASDPAGSGAFANDHDISHRRPKSVICLPLLSRGRRVGILYLENDLVTDAFSEERIELLEMLSTQAAISIENALLYQQLERYSQSLESTVEARTRELAEKHSQLELAFADLHNSQQQLIHSAKMASLGELTAGIAHEIKNPLNFIKNFAEVSIELGEELANEVEEGLKRHSAESQTVIRELLGMLAENMQRIAEHGQRADGIVASMLFHARTGTGQRQPTDVNDLVKHALDLAYHGLRAQNPAFSVALSSDLEADLPKVQAVPQDLARAFLNIINNGLQAAYERSEAAEPGFKPELSVRTVELDDRVEVRVRDNGSGIEPELLEMIFQPFFTTKAAGKGTGLGLSLSYDIVVDGHGGNLKVESRKNEYAEFVIQLPKVG